MERFWMHWKVTNRLYNFARPVLCILRDKVGIGFSVSQCYDKVDLAIHGYLSEQKEVDNLLRIFESELNKVEDEEYEKGFIAGMERSCTVGEFLGKVNSSDIGRITLFKDGEEFRVWHCPDDMYGWTAQEDFLISGMKLDGFDIITGEDNELRIYAKV